MVSQGRRDIVVDEQGRELKREMGEGKWNGRLEKSG